MRRSCLCLSWIVALTLPVTPLRSGPTASVKLTQKYLVLVCLDGADVDKDARKLGLPPEEHALLFTMRNQPRHEAAPGRVPGFALIRFTPELGHRYEVEVRSEPSSFSSRVWERGEWKPVVRDRTADEIVSGEPEWVEDGRCAR